MVLSSCGYNKNTMVRLKAEEAKVPIQGIGIIEGKNIEGIISRQVNLGTGKRKQAVEQVQGDHTTNVYMQ